MVWCLDRQQTFWWYEHQGYWTFVMCEIPAADPVTATLPQLAQPVLQHVAPIIGATIADANEAARVSQQAADARVHAAEMSV